MKKLNSVSKNKLSIKEIILRFFFGFLIPYLVINGIILFFFIQTPTINVVNMDSPNYEKDKIKFSIDCALPLLDIKTLFQDKEVPYSKLGDTYVVDVSDNGTYQIKVVALNKSAANSYVEVEAQDTLAPSIDIDNAIVAGNTLIISVYDDQSGINYDNLYATLSDGSKISPAYVDQASGTVQFQIENEQKIVIHVEDELGNHSETSFNIS